uniref:Uncharacterized protein n=1 Tax=Parascaris equorum TaxID=6256 RepID=A0A914SI37_PAREQ
TPSVLVRVYTSHPCSCIHEVVDKHALRNGCCFFQVDRRTSPSDSHNAGDPLACAIPTVRRRRVRTGLWFRLRRLSRNLRDVQPETVDKYRLAVIITMCKFFIDLKFAGEWFHLCSALGAVSCAGFNVPYFHNAKKQSIKGHAFNPELLKISRITSDSKN